LSFSLHGLTPLGRTPGQLASTNVCDVARMAGDDNDDAELVRQEDDLSSAIPRPMTPAFQPGRTVLPRPFARAVSLVTRSTCLAIRVGTYIGACGFDAAKFTTLSSLELGRGMLEGILSRAGKDVINRSRGELGRADAETVLERSLENLHNAMTQIVFWTTAGFQVTSTTLSMASEVSQLLLSSLDQFFGSTDSSRAIASIITLIRREFQNPATGVRGERVGVVDLMLGLSALAYLQQSCRKLLEEESRRRGIEEVIWDVVVLNDGERVDVHEDSLYGIHQGAYKGKEKISDDLASINAIQRQSFYESSEDDDDMPEIRLKKQIMRSILPDTTVSISTVVNTTKTITVDFDGPQSFALLPPPGVEVVEETVVPTGSTSQPVIHQGSAVGRSESPPKYRIVYRVDQNKLRSTTFRRGDDEDYEESPTRALDNLDSPRDVMARSFLQTSTQPPIPPKIQSSKVIVSRGNDAQQSAAPKQESQRSKQPPDHSKCKSPNLVMKANAGANQKRQRKPLDEPRAKPRLDLSRQVERNSQKPLPTPPKSESSRALVKANEKRGGIRNALKIGNILSKDSGSASQSISSPKLHFPSVLGGISKTTRLGIRNNSPASYPPAEPDAFQDGGSSGEYENAALIPRSSSRASYISVHEHRRDSIISQTDTYSIHSVDGPRPASPTLVRSEVKTHGSIMKSRSEKDIAEQNPSSPLRNQRRTRSHVHTPSLYSLSRNGSQTSLVLSSYYQPSVYNGSVALNTLRRTGMVQSIFPKAHLLENITRYMLFSSASYGSNFLKFMGISKEMPILGVLEDTHHEIKSFAHHTESQTDSILLASFVDPQGGSDSTGFTNTGVPLVHYISLDHDSKAIVLACRGTLGFEDVLADMTCDYDDLIWRGKTYKVHKGIHASARRLLHGADGRVLLTLKEALEEFSDYGLVLCGHSLGGAVTALFAIMLSDPNPSGTGWVTSEEPHNRLLTEGGDVGTSHICLPPGRPIHVYAYGPPGTMSSALRKATRGLITSVVQGNDLVPQLSLGVLHDFQAVALAFKSDDSGAKAEVRQRIWHAFQSGVAHKWYNNATAPGRTSSERDGWAFSLLSTLRSNMMSQKLLPPGEVFVIESSKVLRRDAFLLASEEDLGRPARRVVLKYVRDVESRFREVRFGTSMLVDHSPAKYEDALNKLRLGVVTSI
jgi:hypothetical protein